MFKTAETVRLEAESKYGARLDKVKLITPWCIHCHVQLGRVMLILTEVFGKL